jgi:hypothetical protein
MQISTACNNRVKSPPGFSGAKWRFRMETLREYFLIFSGIDAQKRYAGAVPHWFSELQGNRERAP